LHNQSSFCFSQLVVACKRVMAENMPKPKSLAVDLKKQGVRRIPKRYCEIRDLVTYEISSAEKMNFRE
jgi:hypothetical protein